MAISSIMGGYYAPEYDQRFDSEAQYIRFKEAQYYEEMRRRQMGMQQPGALYNTNNVNGTVQKTNSPKKTEDDPLGFLHNSDNKILLTGEAS